MGKGVKDKIQFWENVAKKEAPAPSRTSQPKLDAENSVAQAEVAAAPKDEPTMSPLQAMLSQHLVDTGRADPLSKESREKREHYSGKVLADMESSTQKRQAAENATKPVDQQRPLTHAVSGHGKGTDQVGRLVHGRRNDEMMDDKTAGTTPGSSVSLSGNKHGLGDMATPEYTTVGSDPKNISGAFSSNSGMLHVVTEGFAQAGMLDRHQQQARKGGDANAKHDQSRFATQVSGPGENIGYNLTLNGAPSQKEGDSVSASDMQSRFADIERDDSMKNATVVLDPAFVDGKRAGWQVQTAFANNNAPGSSMSNPDEVGAEVAKWDQKAAAEKDVADKREEVKLAKKARADAESKANAADKAADQMQKGIDNAKNGPPKQLVDKQANKRKEATDLRATFGALDTAIANAEADLDAAEKALAKLG